MTNRPKYFEIMELIAESKRCEPHNKAIRRSLIEACRNLRIFQSYAWEPLP